MPEASLANAWQAGIASREYVLERARRVSALTVPHLIPPRGLVYGQDLADPYQSVGARGVNNLASKLLLTLFPVQASWFIYEVSPAILRQVFGEAAGQGETQAKLQLAEREVAIQRWFNTRGYRAEMYEFLRHLLVAGTSVCRLYRDGRPPRNYRLPDFQVVRNAEGDWVQLLVREFVRYESFKPAVAAVIGMQPQDEPKEVYTVVRREIDGDRWLSWQEVGNITVPDSEVKYASSADVPWIVSRFGSPAGEDYGRSHGEEMLGDLRSVEGLTQAMVEAAAIAAECKWAVDIRSGATPAQLQSTPNGGHLAADGELIKPIRTDKVADFSFAGAVLERVEKRVEYAYLMDSAVRRDGERVTAEEIRRVAQELEDALGGGFSVMSLELQEPLARKIEAMLVARQELARLPRELADIKVVTGLEALGRGQERVRLRAFADDGQTFFGPEAFAQYIKPTELLRRLALAAGVNPEDLIKTDKELEAQQDQAAVSNVLQGAGPELAKQILASAQQGQQTQG